MTKRTLLTESHVYKPFHLDWAFEAWRLQQQIHWLPEEVPLADDVRDWKKNLTPQEKNLLTHIFRFFTQADIEVNNCYMKQYSRVFGPVEVQMMLTSFANMETIHIAAYSHLLDTIGLPEVEYSAFMKYKEMKDKFDYMQQFNVRDRREIAKTMAVFGAFTEGLQLFASFAMLMNFQRFGKMKGMGQIVEWSVRDETLHCLSMIKLFRTFIEENLDIWDDSLKAEIYEACRQIVSHEDAFIDLAFELGGIQGLTADDMKQYVRCVADRRLVQLGLKANFGEPENPLPWMDEIMNSPKLTNFFEQRVTDYTKAATKGVWDNAMDEERFVIYGREGCTWCEKAKALAEKYQLQYQYVDLTDDADKKLALYNQTGMASVPMVFQLDSEGTEVILGGYTEFAAHVKG